MKDYLEYLNKIQPGLKVQRYIEFPCPWTTIDKLKDYEATYGQVNHREILDHEVVIDVDADLKSHGHQHGNLVELSLKNKGLNYRRYKSGGTGEHFHLWFNHTLTPLLSQYDKGSIRLTIIKYIVGEYNLKPVNLHSHICLHNKTLIQIEGVVHRKGQIKTLISSTKDIMNDLPEEIPILLEKIYKTNEEQRILRETVIKNNSGFKPPCIDFLEGKEINNLKFSNYGDGYNRAMFFLTSFYLHKKTNEELTKYLLDYQKTHKVKLNSTIKGMIDSNKGWARCPSRQIFFEELGCIDICKECPLNMRFKFTNE